MAALLGKHQVVMLGDFGHSDAMPYYSLLNVLEAWLEDLREGQETPSRLTLVLEMDPEFAGLVAGYTKSESSWEALLEYMLPEFSLETLEFVSGLRQIQNDLVKIPGCESESLWIIGKEPESDRKTREISEKEAFRFFVAQRDSLVANGILEHMRTNPNRRLLVFYGNAHLAGGKVNKASWAMQKVPAKESFGFFLPHYLRRVLGENEVLTVDQIPILKRRESVDIVLSDSLVEWDQVSPKHSSKQDPEQWKNMAILRSGKKVPHHPLAGIACSSVIERLSQELQKLKPLQSVSFSAIRAVPKYEKSLDLLTRGQFTSLADWRDTFSADKYDGMSVVRSESFEEAVLDLMESISGGDRQAFVTLLRLGVSEQAVVAIARGSQNDFRKIWENEIGQVLAIQSIGNWWCGNKKEIENAQKYLREFSGREFESPRDAMRWWRLKFQGVDY